MSESMAILAFVSAAGLISLAAMNGFDRIVERRERKLAAEFLRDYPECAELLRKRDLRVDLRAPARDGSQIAPGASGACTNSTVE